jgi:peptide/nickel transport system permease protein
MKYLRLLAIAILAVIAIAAIGAEHIAPTGYAKQFRDIPNAAPCRAHWLGTDQLGRDNFARVVYGTRVSLLLAPAAALLSVLLSALVGGVAGYLGGPVRTVAMAVTDLFLSLPWLFLLITVRALLPLNVSPIVSVTITFFLLGMLGWAASARVVCAGAAAIRDSDFVLQARANGVTSWRIALHHLLPNMKPLLLAQFWISVPVFILSEANLGILGLGVAEPLPSWGGLLRELEDLTAFSGEYWKLAPLLVLLVVLGSFELLSSNSEVNP